MYYFRTIAGWIIHCVIQFVLLHAPIVNPMAENSYPPGWWYELWSYSDWRNNLDSQNRPNNALLSMYWECCWWHMRLRVDKIAEGLVNATRSFLLLLIGNIRSGYLSLGSWLDQVHTILGLVLPSWASTAIDGLFHLFEIFPYAIRYGWVTWSEIWENIKTEVRDWALAFYAATMKFALDAWAWVSAWGSNIRAWWQSFSSWLANFVVNTYAVIALALGAAWSFLVWFFQNPTGRVFGWLAPWWDLLRTFARDCLTYWYNIWGSHASRLSEFLSSPLDYLYDRAEAFLEDKIG